MKQSFYVYNNGDLKRKDNTLQFTNHDGEKRDIPVERISDIYVMSEMSFNTAFINYISQYGIPMHFFNYYNFYTGQAKAIGVSNFEIPHLEALFQTSGIVPAVNQIEYHPLWNHSELYEYCRERGIAVQAYAPLARGAYLKKDTLLHIGETYGKSPAQIGLRWLVQKGISAIPKSVNPKRIAENADIFDFELTDLEMKTIDALDEKFRSAGIPEDMQGFVR